MVAETDQLEQSSRPVELSLTQAGWLIAGTLGTVEIRRASVPP